MPFEEIFYSDKKTKSEKKITVRIVLHGRVQNVGMRNWIKRRCIKEGIDGWVRNRKADETVEALLQGEEETVVEMIKVCYNGPSFAYIKRVKEFPLKGENIPKGFFVLPTV